MSKSNSNPPGIAVSRLLLDSSDKGDHVGPRGEPEGGKEFRNASDISKFSEILGCIFEFHSASHRRHKNTVRHALMRALTFSRPLFSIYFSCRHKTECKLKSDCEWEKKDGDDNQWLDVYCIGCHISVVGLKPFHHPPASSKHLQNSCHESG